MKWIVIGVLLCLAKFGAGGALLRRVPGVKEVHLDKKENEQTNQLVPETPSEKKPVTFEPECDAGSEWESNCHSCKCSDDGVALCTRQEFCDQPLADPIKCKPNTVIQRDCNTCVCLENGLGLCTMKECGKTSVSQKPTPVAAGRECAPGTTWVSRCNRCSCSAEGLAVCNYDEGCPGMESLPNMRCAAGTHWRNDCNMCWCADGVPLCTRKGCITDKLEIIKVNETLDEFQAPEELEDNFTAKEFSSHTVNNDLLKIQEDLKQLYITILELKDKTQEKSYNLNVENVKDLKGNDVETDDKVLEEENEIEKAISVSNHHVVLKRSVCKPNQAFQTDCNVCKCAADGQSFTCTHNECMEGETNKEVEVFMESEGTDHIEKHSVCKPAGTFYIGCNTCHCNFFGTDYSCTNKPCPLPEDVELFHELKDMKPIIPYIDDEEAITREESEKPKFKPRI